MLNAWVRDWCIECDNVRLAPLLYNMCVPLYFVLITFRHIVFPIGKLI